MQKAKSNAALWFAADGYSTNNGLNGRRIAGASFLKAFVKHADVDQLSCLALTSNAHNIFSDMVKDMGSKLPIVSNYLDGYDLPDGIDNVYIPAPNLVNEAWRRAQVSSNAYSISGVTHTICTERVAKSFNEMHYAPTEEWDAVICTSQAVVDSVHRQREEIEAYALNRFGKIAPRYQTPLIPLGVHQDDYSPSDAHRKKWRDKLGIGKDDIAIITFARLASFEKFDPLPLFIALGEASKGFAHKIHMIAVGPYSDNVAKKMFTSGVKSFAPDIQYHHINGAKDETANESWSAADIFTLPVDNIQETFGLAPVEAMSMGLPVVVSDWNGFRDTVTPECGFRVRTTLIEPGSAMNEARGYMVSKLNYNQYIGNVSQMTSIDIKDMTEAFRALINSPELRQKMGAAGKKRVSEIYDWSNVIPQYQEFWAELSTIRKAAVKMGKGLVQKQVPSHLDPTIIFGNYATDHLGQDWVLRSNVQGDAAKFIQWLIKVRGLDALKTKPVSVSVYVRVLKELQNAQTITLADLQKRCEGISPVRVARAVMWFLKYNMATQIHD